jgi:hypothetical protein
MRRSDDDADRGEIVPFGQREGPVKGVAHVARRNRRSCSGWVEPSDTFSV